MHCVNADLTPQGGASTLLLLLWLGSPTIIILWFATS
jgi:hypothetical protein